MRVGARPQRPPPPPPPPLLPRRAKPRGGVKNQKKINGFSLAAWRRQAKGVVEKLANFDSFYQKQKNPCGKTIKFYLLSRPIYTQTHKHTHTHTHTLERETPTP